MNDPDLERLERRIALAEEERGPLQRAGLEHEDDYLKAYSKVEALEMQLESRLRQLKSARLRLNSGRPEAATGA